MIRNIIFDFGMVLLNIDYQHTADSFRKLGIDNFEELYAYEGQQELFDRFETGHINKKDFLDEIRRICGRDLSDEQIVQAWNSMLLDLPAERAELLHDLKDRYRLFLLSNTNSIHVETFTESLTRQFGFDFFSELFEKAYFSCVIGMRKPNSDIFRHILHDSRLVPEETLFIDDVKTNVDAALKEGIHAVLLEPGEDVINLLKKLKL